MLVLTRKNRQSLVIDQLITVKVIEIRGNRIRLGIEAPQGVSVHRGEVVARDKQEMMQ